MFFSRHPRVDKTVIALGIIALFIISSFIFLVLYITRNSTEILHRSSDIQSDREIGTTPVVLTPEEIVVEYTQQLSHIVAQLKSGDEDLTLTSIEHTLFSVHVPQENLSKHLSVSIRIRTLREEGNTLSTEAVQTEVISLISSLIDS
ncbi:MAG: hypothetical protein GW939_00150 [Candidatus Magasanikbacteria bacterium]|uniref:Uncharacterized protein n=1 Tax=Candidatus Magasanikbacteria bacterium CG10_big_fil_rev_8_21_14_0_10_38_6 TaxID=1974647 RepID=A0A2M6P3B5_9BACT|nr:hypothetical protein [Candidatus Magasanikbacteria bacterium]NCS72411.1 hypothetical protein [Candidatus Magasanikbacteria bacterium]PIR77870.1 MAG: hypothetical protein COU30_00165 [Candidatus Magasanikbacteria bacterium CG10_big_fil_rev_8_21_14_0_10_38_6]